MSMTWTELKEHVDQAMSEQGISPDDIIAYIDVSYPDAEFLQVQTDGPDGSINIVSL